MSNPNLSYALSRIARLRMTWLGIRIACAEFGISPFDRRIAWGTVCALWSTLR